MEMFLGSQDSAHEKAKRSSERPIRYKQRASPASLRYRRSLLPHRGDAIKLSWGGGTDAGAGEGEPGPRGLPAQAASALRVGMGSQASSLRSL